MGELSGTYLTEEKGIFRILVGKPKGKRSLGTPSMDGRAFS